MNLSYITDILSINRLQSEETTSYNSKTPKGLWRGKEFQDAPEYRATLTRYLEFVCSPQSERNIEIVKKSGYMRGSDIANSIDYDITPNHVGVLRNKYAENGIMNQEKEITDLTRDIIDVFEHYEKECPEDSCFKQLVAASKPKSSRKIYSIYDENESFMASKLPKNTNYSRTTYHQDALSLMDESGLVNWEERSMNARVTTEPPYDFLKDFLCSMEHAIEKQVYK